MFESLFKKTPLYTPKIHEFVPYDFPYISGAPTEFFSKQLVRMKYKEEMVFHFSLPEIFLSCT